MTRNNKMVALVLAIAVFLVMVLSVSVITHDADHECIGNGCPVCQEMESARQSLKMLASGILAIASAFALIYTSYQFICCFAQPLLQGSLVALKVELLN